MRNRTSDIPARLLTAVVTMVLLAGILPANALAAADEPLSRREMIRRAKTWTTRRVPYSQSGYRNGYRRDCSGFVSMAWDLPENLVTWRLPLVAKPINKNQLQPGDILLDATSGGGGKHVIIFERWADKRRTRYVALESTGQDSVEGAIRRVMPYPYRVNKSRYKPYRYTSMNRYWKAIPHKLRQPVRGYRGHIEVPAKVRARRVAQREAEIRASEVKARKRAALEQVAVKKAVESRRRLERDETVVVEARAAESIPVRLVERTRLARELVSVFVESIADDVLSPGGSPAPPSAESTGRK